VLKRQRARESAARAQRGGDRFGSFAAEPGTETRDVKEGQERAFRATRLASDNSRGNKRSVASPTARAASSSAGPSPAYGLDGISFPRGRRAPQALDCPVGLFDVPRRRGANDGRFALDLLIDIPSKLLAVSPNMMDTKFCSNEFPFVRQSSLALFAFEPKVDDLGRALQRASLVSL
jgi:hypothetical protein